MGAPAMIKVVSDVLASTEPAPATAPAPQLDETSPVGA